MKRLLRHLAVCLIAVTLVGCGSPPVRTELPAAAPPTAPATSAPPMPAPWVGDVGLPNTPRSRWIPARWEELPGWQKDPLHEAWEGDNAKAYLGTVVPNFPNLFVMYGPNLQPGHGGSLIVVVEMQMMEMQMKMMTIIIMMIL